MNFALVIVFSVFALHFSVGKKSYTKSPTGKLFEDEFYVKLCSNLKTTGCACWWDVTGNVVKPNDCACCEPKGIQCGYPVHHSCQSERISYGCKGKAL